MSPLGELRVRQEAAAGLDNQQSTAGPQAEAIVELLASRSHPLLIDPDQSVATEHFGILRARVLNARANSGICSLLVSSASGQEGKSLTSINLAISLAQLGRYRILLVDGDLRKGGISRLLRLRGRSGVADFLEDRERFSVCVKKTTLPCLSVAPCGQVSEESLPGILEGPRWAEFLRLAKHNFELIIVDSVPVLVPIADFELLLAACDAALLVVHLHKTARASLEVVAQHMSGKLLGVIVNNTEPPLGSDYSYYRDGKDKGKGSE